MNQSLVSFIVGVVFAIGLGVSGMTQPQKIISFLDPFAWDASLMFVMLGALVVHTTAYRLIKNRRSPLLSPHWHVPTKTEITPQLIVGSALFGIGWGLGGLCPGPALVSLVTLDSRIIVFVGMLIFGMVSYNFLERFIPLRK